MSSIPNNISSSSLASSASFNSSGSGSFYGVVRKVMSERKKEQTGSSGMYTPRFQDRSHQQQESVMSEKDEIFFNGIQQTSSPFFTSIEESRRPLRIGDMIVLYVENPETGALGFLNVNGIVDCRCGIIESAQQQVPTNYKDCIFIVHNINQYSATKQYYKALEESDINTSLNSASVSTLSAGENILRTIGQSNQRSSNLSRQTAILSKEELKKNRLKQLQEKMEQERKNSAIESELSLGRDVFYGQSIQLMHAKSRKFLTVSRESAELHKDCMKLTLDKHGSTASYFIILPYFRFKREGERVQLGDQIRIWSKKFNQYVHASRRFQYVDDPYERKEVNVSTSFDPISTKWRMIMYSGFIQQNVSKSNVHIGDMIRIYHKELEGYLAVPDDQQQSDFELLQSLLGNRAYKRTIVGMNDTQENRLSKMDIQRVKILLSDDESRNMSNSLWEIEIVERSKGGLLSWIAVIRLRHVASGKYLAVVPLSDSSDDENENLEQDDNDDDEENDSQTKAPQKSQFSSTSKENEEKKGKKMRSNTLQSKKNTMPLKSIVKRSSSLKKPGAVSIQETPSDVFESKEPKTLQTKSSLKGWNTVKQTFGMSSSKVRLKLPQMENAVKSEDANEEFELVITDSSGPETLFSLHSIAKISTPDQVPFDSAMRILHKQTKCWVHGFSIQFDQFEISKPSNTYVSDEPTYCDVEAVPHIYPQDVFAITSVSSEEKENMNFVQSILPSMLTFIGKISQSKPLRSTDCIAIIKIFTELIFFCTKSNEQNPFIREGIPYPNRQRVLRERRIIDITMNILKLPFEKGYIRLESIYNPEYKAYQKMFRLGYRLIKQICKENNKNALYMSKYIGDLQSHFDHGLGAEEALLAIITDNFALLNRITLDQVKFFVDLLVHRSANNSRYLQFLSALCSCEDRAVVKNQDYIVSLLTQSEAKEKDPTAGLLIPYMKNDNVYLMINGNEIEITTFARLTATNQEAHCDYAKLMEFVEDTIYLFSKLCMGRNGKSIPMIHKIFSFDLILSCIKNKYLKPRLRANFCYLLLHAYLDVNPYTKKIGNISVRKWAEIGKTKNEQNDSTFKDLKVFLRQFFGANCSLDQSNIQMNRFILVMVQLCRYMFEFGLYRDVIDITTTLEYLFTVLDGTNDKNQGDIMPSSVRYKESEGNLILSRIKVEICKIILLVMDLRTSRRISKFLAHYKEIYEKNHSTEKEIVVSSEDEKKVREIFNDFKAFGSRMMNMEPILLDLTRYENYELATSALQVLFKYHLQREELASILTKIELLVSPEMVKSYDLLKSRSSQLAQSFRSRIDDEELEWMLNILNSMTDNIKQNGQRSQRLLRNLGIHNICICNIQSKIQDKNRQFVLNRALVKFLTEFVRNNQENQKLLFPHIHIFISLISIWKIDTTELLFEIVKNNRTLCSTIDEQDVKSFVDVMEENNLCAHYLHFLRAITMVDGKEIMRNQTIVTKILMERQKDVIVLFNDEEGIRERNRLIKQNDHINNPDGLLNYHIILLNLFCECAAGKNHVTEVKLQSLLSMDQLIDQLMDPYTIVPLRNPLMKFLGEVYINTEKQSMDVSDSAKLWQLFLKFSHQLSSFLSEDNYASDDKPEDSKHQPISNIDIDHDDVGSDFQSNQLNEEEKVTLNPEELRIDSYYVFKLMLPCIQFFFQRHFQFESITPDKKELIEELVLKIIRVYSKVANQNQRNIIKKCLEAVHHPSLPDHILLTLRKFFNRLENVRPIKMDHEHTTLQMEGDETICITYAQYIKKIENIILEDSTFDSVATYYTDSAPIVRSTLISILMRIHSSGYNSETVKITLNGLKTLHTLGEKSKESQEELASAGAADLVIRLCCSTNHEVVSAALDLGILLLSEGNNAVQQMMLDIFKESRSDAFFVAIRDRIRRSIAEIKERRYFEKQKIEKLQAIREMNNNKDKNYEMLQKKKNFELYTEELQNEKFEETGHIKKILRFLQLMCEGHNLKLQNYLCHQEYTNTVSINLVQECLNYTVELQKYINQTNVDIAIQAFNSLTEFVQGPCPGNQRILGTAKLFFITNELLSDQFDHKMRVIDGLRLKHKILITLISLTEGCECQSICDLMRSSLNVNLLVNNMFRYHRLLSQSPQALHQDLVSKVKKNLTNVKLYTEAEAEAGAFDIEDCVQKIIRRYEKVGIQYYILLNILRDSEKLLPKQRQVVTELFHHDTDKEPVSCELFQNQTGSIEVLRENKIERVYFRIPQICTLLSEKSKLQFEQECPRGSSQEKIQTLFEQTNKFRIEVEHYASNKKKSKKTQRLWSFVQKKWNSIQNIGFLCSIVINLVVLFIFKKTIDTMNGIIPIPGDTVIKENESLQYNNEYILREFQYVMLVLGIIQILVNVVRTLLYIKFFLKLNVKLQFDLGKTTRWKDVKRDWKFQLRFIYAVITDYYLWFLIAHLVCSFLALVISPLIYAVLLFEVILRFNTLKNVLRSITMNIKTLSLTFALLIVSLFFFSNIAFLFLFEKFTLPGGIRMCNTSLDCFASMMNYGLRSKGFWEDLIDPDLSWGALVFDLAFNFVNIILLVNMVFGIILESFARLREERELHEHLISSRCFVCDIEKSRFDVKANEGIDFESHIRMDHYLWNYVFFLIYIYKKDPTEYTGTEQYVSDLAHKDDLSFFPVLRSLVLEEAEEKENRNKQLSKT